MVLTACITSPWGTMDRSWARGRSSNQPVNSTSDRGTDYHFGTPFIDKHIKNGIQNEPDTISKKNASRPSYTISEDHTNLDAVRRKRLCALERGSATPPLLIPSSQLEGAPAKRRRLTPLLAGQGLDLSLSGNPEILSWTESTSVESSATEEDVPPPAQFRERRTTSDDSYQRNDWFVSRETFANPDLPSKWRTFFWVSKSPAVTSQVFTPRATIGMRGQSRKDIIPWEPSVGVLNRSSDRLLASLKDRQPPEDKKGTRSEAPRGVSLSHVRMRNPSPRA